MHMCCLHTPWYCFYCAMLCTAQVVQDALDKPRNITFKVSAFQPQCAMQLEDGSTPAVMVMAQYIEDTVHLLVVSSLHEVCFAVGMSWHVPSTRGQE